MAIDVVMQTWREIESRSEHSFFLSSYWIASWLRAVRPDALLFLASSRDGAVGAALIARAPRSIRNPLRQQYRLHETGTEITDGLFIEYNGVLADRAVATEVLGKIVAAFERHAVTTFARMFRPQLIISAATSDFAATLQSLYPQVEVCRRDHSPFVDLARLRNEGDHFSKH